MTEIDSPAAAKDQPDAKRPRGFRPTARRRNRLAAGLALGAVAIGGNVLIYSSLNASTPVVQAVRDIPAGEQISADMLRTVDVDVDASVNVVPGDHLDLVVGQYAKVRVVSGSLVVEAALQPTPLLEPGNAVVALEVNSAELPIGLRERVPVQLVVPNETTTNIASVADGADANEAALSIDGRVVGLPTMTESGLGTQSLSVEVAASDAATVAAADDVRVVLMVPEADPAVEPDAAVPQQSESESDQASADQSSAGQGDGE